eukprot:CAMPEP_0179855352 /NCGR_PEP_ID=MMETSP0982-20121206/10474_1 /TAXON_ID=483367 /ORGANISM="non described non described, Strain CCMP 2436" /LENGTH=39 /DNA_ID= /DNA_START= /DNA_END= /DNA_ORIENTATION=
MTAAISVWVWFCERNFQGALGSVTCPGGTQAPLLPSGFR